MKPNKNILIDLFTLISFILIDVSGFGMHISGHGSDHALWHCWAVSHVVSAIIFVTCVAFHVKGHWSWYESLFSTGIGNKRRVTIILTVLMLAVTLSGIMVMLLSDHKKTTMVYGTMQSESSLPSQPLAILSNVTRFSLKDLQNNTKTAFMGRVDSEDCPHIPPRSRLIGIILFFT